MIFRKRLFFRIISLLTALLIVIPHLSLNASAASGFYQIEHKVLSQNSDGNKGYYIACRTEMDECSVYGKISVSAINGGFDGRGETYQAFFSCLLLTVAMTKDADGKEIRGFKAITPGKTLVSFTADVETRDVELVSAKPEYDDVNTAGADQYSTLWQIEADGDYHVVIAHTGLGERPN